MKFIFRILVVVLLFSNNLFAQNTMSVSSLEYLSLLSKATSHFLNIELPEAERDYLACLKLNSRSAVCYYQLSRIANIYNKLDKAIYFAKRSLELENTNTWYAVNLSNLCMKVNDFNGALDALNKIVNDENYHLFAENYYEIYLAKKDYSNAIIALQKKEKRIGFSKDIVFRIYENAIRVGDMDLAEKSLKKLLLHYPDNFELYSRLFDDYHIQNKLDKCEDLIVVMQNNYMHESYINLIRGDLAVYKNDTNKVFENYEKAFSSLDLPYFYKFKFLTDLKSFNDDYYNHPKMENLYKILMVNHSDSASLNAEYSLYFADNYQFDKAIERVEYAIKLDNSNFNYYHLLFNYLDFVCDYKKLLRATSDCLELYPLNNEVLLFHAISLIYLNNLDEAEDYISSVNKNSLKDFTSALFCYANSLFYQKSGNINKAKNYYFLALENAASPLIISKMLDNFMDEEVNETYQDIIQSFINLDSNQAYFYYLYAKFLFKQNNIKDAKYFIDKAKEKQKFFHVKLEGLYNQIYNK